MMKDILITAFEPFGNQDKNVSQEVLNRLDEKYIRALLPVSYNRARYEVKRLLEKYQPKLVLCLGEAGKEKTIRVEKLAINYTRAIISDNDGDLRPQGAIVEGGQNCYFSPLSVEELVPYLNHLHYPSVLSLTAGGFVCNVVYYTVLEAGYPALFVHLPYYEGQNTQTEHLPLEMMIEAVQEILRYFEKRLFNKA
ncbi:MAG: hypothetical protein PHP41_05050 [Bacilli bacterium]|nr:hypothetical protein [Bacilli bacterium]MDY0064306.1 hypothetical protein [Bacilli bacterium]